MGDKFMIVANDKIMKGDKIVIDLRSLSEHYVWYIIVLLKLFSNILIMSSEPLVSKKGKLNSIFC